MGKSMPEDAFARSSQGKGYRRQRDGGYLLLAIMLMMALMIIVATTAAPRVVEQIRRDREEEMIHRGTEYARAIKKFYKRNGRYPTSLDELDKGEIRYLRRRYLDPLTKDGTWKLLKYGDIQTLLNAVAGTNTGFGSQVGTLTPGGAVISGVPSPTSANFVVPQQRQDAGQANSGITSFPSNSDQGFNPEGTLSNGYESNSSSGEGAPSSENGQQNSPGSAPAANANSSQQNGVTGAVDTAAYNQGSGGGAVVGVASLSKESTIRVYNKKKTYNEWQFIYSPTMDQSNVLLRGPYQPTKLGSAQVGMPASQMNGNTQSNASPVAQNPSAQSP